MRLPEPENVLKKKKHISRESFPRDTSRDTEGERAHPGGMVRAEDEGAHRRMEQMEKGDLDSMEAMQRTMRMCSIVGVVLCVCVVVASVLLWDNMGFSFGSSGLNGYAVRGAGGAGAAAGAADGRPRAGVAALDSARDKHHQLRRASSAHRLAEARVKKKLAARALDLAEKAVINEVAAKYAPASFLAAHRRPEAAAIRDITSSRAAADRVQDRVEGEMIDEHYGGRTNEIAYQVKMELPHMSTTQRNSLIENMAASATARAMHHMAGLVDKQWVDRGLGEKKSAGWIQEQIKGNIDNAPPPAPPPAHAGMHRAGASSSRGSGMSLPGLGRVSSPDQAAKALARLAAKNGGGSTSHGGSRYAGEKASRAQAPPCRAGRGGRVPDT